MSLAAMRSEEATAANRDDGKDCAHCGLCHAGTIPAPRGIFRISRSLPAMCLANKPMGYGKRAIRGGERVRIPSPPPYLHPVQQHMGVGTGICACKPVGGLPQLEADQGSIPMWWRTSIMIMEWGTKENTRETKRSAGVCRRMTCYVYFINI